MITDKAAVKCMQLAAWMKETYDKIVKGQGTATDQAKRDKIRYARKEEEEMQMSAMEMNEKLARIKSLTHPISTSTGERFMRESEEEMQYEAEMNMKFQFQMDKIQEVREQYGLKIRRT